MRRYLVCSSTTGMFSFLDELDVAMTVIGTIGERSPIRQYGLWAFPETVDFLTFTASQLTDALTWASAHGERIVERAEQFAVADRPRE